MRSEEEVRAYLNELKADREDEDQEEDWEELDGQIDALKWVLS